MKGHLTVLYAGLIFSCISFNDLVVEPHVSNSHSVLSEGSGFVGANRGSGTQSFDGFKILDQAVLGSHSFGSECQAHSHSGQESFRHVSYDDACA